MEKRCGHRTGNGWWARGKMLERIKAGLAGKVDDGFVLLARTDAVAAEGLEAGIERAVAYQEAGPT